MFPKVDDAAPGMLEHPEGAMPIWRALSICLKVDLGIWGEWGHGGRGVERRKYVACQMILGTSVTD